MPAAAPADLKGTLQGLNTLSPDEREVLGQMHALATERDKVLAAQADAAEQQAQQASQQYQQAVQQPPPGPGLESLIPMAMGNLASLIGQSPAPMERGRETVKENRGQIMKARAENLKHLQGVYQQRADEAQKLGDLEATEKFRKQYETLAKTLETLGQGLDRQDKKDRELAGAADKKHDRINQMEDNIRQNRSITDYEVVRDQMQTGLDARNARSSAGDIVLMRALARATDPRTGVREEEYRTFKGAQGALMSLGTSFTTGMVGKGQLTEFGRNALLERIASIEKRKRVHKDRAVTRYHAQAKELEIDPTLLIQDYNLEAPLTPKAQLLEITDRAAFVQLLKQYPELNDDPEVIGAARKLKGK